MKKRRVFVALVAGVFAAGLTVANVSAGADAHGNGSVNGNGNGNGKVNHLVFIYEENHSFDNLYGTWGPVNGDAVNGLPQADLAHTVQVAQSGTPYTCLAQNDVNLTTTNPPTNPPLSVQCIDPIAAVGQSHFINLPWNIDALIPATATTCPAPNVFAAHGVLNGQGLPGGCTADLVHRFYQEQYQIDGGKQDRYVTGSDAVGLTMGSYDSTKLPIYAYLHSAGAPSYVIGDNFFQGGFGGSFLNHQVLVSAQAPVFVNADKSGVQTGCNTGTANCDLHSVVDANGFPNTYPLYTPTAAVKDQQLTEAADNSGGCTPSYPTTAVAPAGTLCGDYAVNTTQPFTQPYAPGTAVGKRLPLLTSPNIGDAMSAKNVSWAWYAGGWDNAAGNNGRDAMHPLGPGWTNGPTNTASGSCAAPAGEFLAANVVFPNCPDALFQFHHQPFGYFASYADGTPGRLAHLKDEAQFMLDAQQGHLPAVSFVKPIGEENEHPGYASEAHGSDHLVDLIQTILNGPDGKDTMIVVTYDEFGGQWDHVSPPGTDDNPGPHDAFGPGTRVPVLILGAGIRHSGVDHDQMDTTSILATIEHRFNVKPLRNFVTGQPTRDAYVNDLFGALNT